MNVTNVSNNRLNLCRFSIIVVSHSYFSLSSILNFINDRDRVDP